jgi:hypothetical protein
LKQLNNRKKGAGAPSGSVGAVGRQGCEMALIRAAECTRRLSTTIRVLSSHIVARVRWGGHVAGECIQQHVIKRFRHGHRWEVKVDEVFPVVN